MLVSPILENALDSMRIGMEYFQRERDYSSRKHAILTVFHAIELLLKEKLHRTNPMLIYKNIDKKIGGDSYTVGLDDALIRLDNAGVSLPKGQKDIVKRIQARRNRIEHHKYDHDPETDELVVGEALKFVFYFSELVLDINLSDHIDPSTISLMQEKLFKYNEREALAESRFHRWAKDTWPEWDETKEDSPEQFEGTQDCPICRQCWLIIGHHQTPFCFYCNASVNAAACDQCGRTYMNDEGCCNYDDEYEQN